MPIQEFNEQMQANFSDKIYDTIGGIIVAQFGRLPKTLEAINIEGFEFIIKSADARCIHLIECFDRRNKDEPQES
jgi:magnesium and cobalt transporter